VVYLALIRLAGERAKLCLNVGKNLNRCHVDSRDVRYRFVPESRPVNRVRGSQRFTNLRTSKSTLPMSDTFPPVDPATKNTGRKRGRPSTYTVEIAEAIWERLLYGESLRQICRDEMMPGRTTVFQWLTKHPDFASMYADARWDGIEWLLDETIEIAKTEPDLARARVMINTRYSLIGRMQPRKYW
jgi:hypothetical protein